MIISTGFWVDKNGLFALFVNSSFKYTIRITIGKKWFEFTKLKAKAAK